MRQKSVVLLSFLLGCTSHSSDTQVMHSLQGQGLGTTWSVRWEGSSATEDEVTAAVVDALTQVDAHMSTWKPDSEINTVRNTPGRVAVSSDTVYVVDMALQLAQATEGAFDPTVQPLVELWGFHGDPIEQLPSDDALAAAQQQIGWQRVQTGWEGGTPWVDADGTALDLSAIAKGYVVDRMSESISALGIGTHLVEVGGEVRVSGPGPDGGWWSVGIDSPVQGTAPGQSMAGIVRVVNGAVATSGNYRQTRTVQGVEVHHTLDPRTGRPSTARVGSATVTAPTCALADGLATALMVMGADGLALVESLDGVEAGLLWAEPSGIRTEGTSGFRLQMVTDPIQPAPPPHE